MKKNKNKLTSNEEAKSPLCVDLENLNEKENVENASVEEIEASETAELAVRLASADTFEDVLKTLAKIYQCVGGENMVIWKPDSDTLKYNELTESTSEEGIVEITNARICEWGYDEQPTKFGVLYVPQPMPEDCSSYFGNCEGLSFVETDNWDTSNTVSINRVFACCKSITSLNLDSWDTYCVKDMDSVFAFCQNLISLNLTSWNTNNVEIMSWIFCECQNLVSLDLSGWRTDNVRDMKCMFCNCYELTTLDFGDNWDMANVKMVAYMFSYCIKLTTVTGTISNIKRSLDLHHSPLTADSAMVFINGLYDYAAVGGKRKHRLVLSSATKRSLTDEQIAVATKKGWKIA